MIKVLSLFDWISCGQVALNRFRVPYRYFASENDKNAIKITHNNFPNTFHLWSICDLRYNSEEDTLYYWKVPYDKIITWDKDNSHMRLWKIDLLIWWPPCQWFSYAWKMLNFEDKRSKLFFEYARILKETKPRFFIMENVKMKKEYSDIITDHLFSVESLFIDSQLIWAQQRKRLYWVWELQKDWTYKKVDFPNPTGPGKMLEDILQPFEEIEEKYFLNEEQIEKAIKNCKGKIFKSWKSNWNAPLVRVNKALCLTARSFWKSNRQVNRIIQYPRWFNKWWLKWDNWKVPTITTNQWKYNNYLLDSWWRMRVFTEIEQERLQCLPDNYTQWIPTYLREYHIWNWFHVDTMEYILSFIIEKLKNNKSC